MARTATASFQNIDPASAAWRVVDPSAVVDIGSNSVRMVVYGNRGRAPAPIFNEKLLCGLGRELDATGRLAEDGVERALDALPRFAAILDAMGVEQIDYLATAAVREAENGDDFVRRAEDLCHHPIRVLSGIEEARLSGLGVLSGTPEAEGMMADLGGGSAELVELAGGTTGRQATLPLGPLRLDEKVVREPARAKKEIERHLDSIEWLRPLNGQQFFAVGGAWRTFARLHMVHYDSPLHIIHHYTIPRARALDFAEFIGKLSPSTLRKVHGVSKRRVDTLPYAATLLAHLIKRMEPDELVFSAYGLREGALFDRLDDQAKAEDPLIAGCRAIGDTYRTADVAVDGDALNDWLAPVFDGESDEEARLRHAACLLSNIAYAEHPDYRGEHALMRSMRLPLVGLGHEGRAYLGVAVSARHSRIDEEMAAYSTVTSLLTPKTIARASAIGLGIRVAYTLSGGMRDLLDRFALSRTEGSLILSMRGDESHLMGEAVERRLSSFASALDLKAEITYV